MPTIIITKSMSRMLYFREIAKQNYDMLRSTCDKNVHKNVQAHTHTLATAKTITATEKVTILEFPFTQNAFCGAHAKVHSLQDMIRKKRNKSMKIV